MTMPSNCSSSRFRVRARPPGRRQHGAPELRRPERPSLSVDRQGRAGRARRTEAGRGVDAGHPGLGAANPARLESLLNSQPSYVFFREGRTAMAGRSARSACPDAERSIAIDPRSVPLGARSSWRPPGPTQRAAEPPDVWRRIPAARSRERVRADFSGASASEAGNRPGA